MLENLPAPAAFAVHGEPVEDEGASASAGKRAKPGPAAKKPKNKKKNVDKKKDALVPLDEAMQEIDTVPETSFNYKAQNFRSEQLKFVKDLRALTGISHKEALSKWMISKKRTHFLADMPVQELKKRRFA